MREDEQQEAFEILRAAFVNAPVLARPDFDKPFTLQTDASDYALGAVLTQEDKDGEHPIVYISRALIHAEKNYSTTVKECLAVVWVIKKMRPYLKGYVFTVITDHSFLKWLFKIAKPSGRVVHWIMELQQ